MKTKTLTVSLLAVVAGAAGCSSSNLGADGAAGQTGTDAQPDVATEQLYGLSTGVNCFDVVSIAPGYSDGCQLAVDGVVGAALPVDYDMIAGTVTVGDGGSLGGGAVAHNMATLSRDGTTSDSSMTSCTWHQTDTSMFTLTATNQFTLAVTEVENTFATACSGIPTGGSCTSTWTWTMKKSTTKTPPSCQ